MNDKMYVTIEEIENRAELHCHTKMSAMGGIISAADLINRAKSLGHTAVAITDHGCVQAFPEAYRASQETGVKVIYGAEVYLKTTGDPGALFKVTLLVKNQIGLKSLYKLISKALTDNYKIRPIVLDTELINCREGLLVGSACTHGELQYDILHRYNYDKFLEIAESDEFADMMRKADIPDWYIASCKKITYIFPKAHAVSYTMTAFRLGWFKAHYPEDFYIISLEVASYGKRSGYLSYDLPKVKDELKEIEATRGKSGLAIITSTYNNLRLRLEMLERGVGVQ